MRLNDLPADEYHETLAATAKRYGLWLSRPSERVAAVRIAEREVAGEPVELPTPDVTCTAFAPAVADRVGADAHRWLAHLEATIQLLGLRRDDVRDRRRADQRAAELRPDLLPRDPVDRERAIVSYVESGATRATATASGDDYERVIAAIAHREGLSLRVPADRAKAAGFLAAERPDLVMPPRSRAKLAASAPPWPPRPTMTPTTGAPAAWASGPSGNTGKDGVSVAEKRGLYDEKLRELLRGAGLDQRAAAHWDTRERARYLRILADLATQHPDLVAAVSGAGA